MWRARTRGAIGQATPGATLLTKVACEAMVGKRPHVSVFGSDYPTPDGTGVRDYLHIEDLAAAHLNALAVTCEAAANRPRSMWVTATAIRCAKCLRMVESVGGKALNIREEARRAGDPAYLVARAERIRSRAGLAAAL